MNPEKHNDISGLEKILALKQEQELKRQESENQKRQFGEQEELAKSSEYQLKIEELAKIISRREEILKRLIEIKSQRGNIIKTGHNAVLEARQDKEIEKILHTKEGFNEVFSNEKIEWKDLQQEVNNLNQELEKLNSEIPEKENQAGELLSQTKEGKEQKEKELAEKFIEIPREGFIKEIEYGEKWCKLNVPIKNNLSRMDFFNLSDQEKVETKETILSYLNKEIDKEFLLINKKEGLENIKQDIDRVNEFLKESNEVLPEIDKFREEAPKILLKYEELFKEHKEIDNIIGKYYGNYGENRNENLVYLNSYKSQSGDNKLFETKKILRDVNIEKNESVPDPKKTKRYIEKAHEFNSQLISLIENNDVEKIKEIFSGMGEGIEKYFGFNPWFVARNLYENYHEQLIKSHESEKLSLPFTELVKYYNQIISKQEKQKELLLSGFSASLDMVALSGESENTITNKEFELKDLEEKKKEAKTFLRTLEDARKQLRDKLNEEILFESEIANRTFDVPKFTPEVKEIEDYVIEIKKIEENLKNLRKDAAELQNKKLGIFESKAKHGEKVNEAWKNIKDIENNEYMNSLNSFKYFLNIKNDILANIWHPIQNRKIDWKKDVKFGIPIKLGEALLKIEDYLSPISNRETPQADLDLINKYKEAKQKFEESKREIFILSKK